jgi:hypothetical protein
MPSHGLIVIEAYTASIFSAGDEEYVFPRNMIQTWRYVP